MRDIVRTLIPQTTSIRWDYIELPDSWMREMSSKERSVGWNAADRSLLIISYNPSR